MSGATFGRKAAGGDAAMAAHRAAFLAAERARADRPAGDREEGWRAPHGSGPVLVRERSLGTAYLLWFFLGGFGAHRFYLGCPNSGLAQALLLPLSWMLILSGALWTFLPLILGGLWILSDLFVIPSLRRQANERLRQNAIGSVFA